MNTSTPDNDKRQQLRRKLIRGSFSVPAVLAVHNGSALAASSNRVQCAKNSIQNGTTTGKMVNTYKEISTGTIWVNYQELSNIASAMHAEYTLPSFGYFKIPDDNSSSQPVNGFETVTGQVPVIFTIDNDVITLVGAQGMSGLPSGGGPISASCWSSLAVATP
jgi:hypothetical protein